MRTFARKISGGFLLAGLSGWAGSACAGQGFYLGLEGGANFAQKEKFDIYGDQGGILGGALDDGTTIAKDKLKTGWLGGATVGYGSSGGLRFEIEGIYRDNKFDKGEAVQGASTALTTADNLHGKNDVTAAMGNLWIGLFPSSSLHPYIGGGAGYAQVKFKDIRYGGVELSNDDDKVFAWQAGAGLEVDLSPHVDLGLGYRYFRTNKGKFDLLDTTGTHVESRYRAHSALLTLRYSFGGEEKPPAVAEAPPPPVEVVPVEPTPAPEPPPPPPPPPACQAPEPGQPMTLEGCKTGDTIVLRGVNFDFNKATLTTNAKTILDQVAEALTKRTDIKVEVDGHTDAKGSDQYNEKLSQRRADSVRQYLIGRGIDAGRMTTKGMGESQPVADNNTDEGRELNRRVELKVTEGGGEGVTVAPPAGTDASASVPAADAAAPAHAP